MARRTQFLDMVSMLRSELGRSESVAVGVDDVPRLKYHINRAYETRFDDHDWPHLRKLFDKINLNANQSRYSFPSDLDYSRIEGVWIWWNGLPTPITKSRGITPDHYRTFDTLSTVGSEPVTRWDVRDASGQPEFEVWPMPKSSTTQKIQFLGHRKVTKLVNDADLCLLDDYLIVLDAAYAICKDSGEKARIKQEANERFVTIRANAASGDDVLRYGLETPPADPMKGITLRVA